MVATVEMERVWDRTAAFVDRRRAALAMLVALGLFVPAVIAGVCEAAAAAATGPASGLWSGVRLVASVGMLWAELAIVVLAVAGGPVRPALRQAARRLPMVIAAVLLLTVALLLLALPAAGILSAYGFDFAAAAAGESVQPSAVAAAWIALYALVLLPLLLWIGARIVLLVPVILEERRGFGALARSFALTRGLAARLIGMMLLYALVLLVVTAAVRFAAGTVLTLAFGSDDGLGAASVLTLVLTTAAECVLAMLLWAFIGMLYGAARERQDGTAAHR